MRKYAPWAWALPVVVAASLAGGYEPNLQRGSSQSPGKSAKEDKWPAFTPEREAAALAFARENHSELVELLGQLKRSNQAEYERAIRELAYTSETLAQTRSRDPKRHDLDIRAWKINSRIQLLTARMTMGPTQTMQDELKAALAEQLDIRLEQLKLDRERTASRLEKLDSAIKTIEDNRQQQTDERLAKLLSSVEKTRAKAKTNRPKETAKRKLEKSAPKPE